MKTPHHLFMPQEGVCEISVDRLESYALGQLQSMAEVESSTRVGPFQGWAVVPRDLAEMSGRRVQCSPTPQNQYHTDIVLPDAARHAREEKKRHAQELAASAYWQGKR